MSYNLHNDNIDLDDQSLFEYVMQMNAIEDSIKYVPPKYPQTFGYMAEPFENKLSNTDENEKKSSYGFFVVCVIIIILLLVVCAVVFTGSCGNSESDYDNIVRFNALSPEIGPDVRAIFVRN